MQAFRGMDWLRGSNAPTSISTSILGRAGCVDSLLRRAQHPIHSEYTCFSSLASHASSDSTVSSGPSDPKPRSPSPPQPTAIVIPPPMPPPPSAPPPARPTRWGGTTTSPNSALGPQGVFSAKSRPSIRRVESQPAGMKAASVVCVEARPRGEQRDRQAPLVELDSMGRLIHHTGRLNNLWEHKITNSCKNEQIAHALKRTKTNELIV